MKYETWIASVILKPTGQPIFSEQATHVRLCDEAGGLFVEIEQEARVDLGKVHIAPDEWPAIRRAVNRMMREIARIEASDGER